MILLITSIIQTKTPFWWFPVSGHIWYYTKNQKELLKVVNVLFIHCTFRMKSDSLIFVPKIAEFIVHDNFLFCWKWTQFFCKIECSLSDSHLYVKYFLFITMRIYLMVPQQFSAYEMSKKQHGIARRKTLLLKNTIIIYSNE